MYLKRKKAAMPAAATAALVVIILESGIDWDCCWNLGWKVAVVWITEVEFDIARIPKVSVK